MSGHVRYYPVSNGDTTLMVTPEEQEILVDCKLAESDPPFDVHSDLVERLGTQDGRPYLPAFILTHGDEDHCLGFDRTFHTGPPSEYEEPDEDDELPDILIGTLWFSPHILSDDELCDDAEVYQEEAERRLKLHKEGAEEKDEPGNRIVVIGCKSDEGLEDIPDDILFTAGDEIESVDHTPEANFSIFIHAPFRRDLDNDVVERNDTSIAFMAGFDADGTENASTFFFGGDANYAVLKEILRQSRYHDNEDWLEYDVLQTPHHCSWSSFNETPYEDNQDPREESLEFFEHNRSGARIVASSKPIEDDDDNPPHHPAKEEYVDIVGDDQFYCTATHPNEDNPQPIVFEVTADGPALERATAAAVVSSGTSRQQQSQPEYG